MNTVIRDPQDLPDWFDIFYYEQWQHLSPERAMWGIYKHIDVLEIMSEYVESTNRDADVLEGFEKSVTTLGIDPYFEDSDEAYEMFSTVSPQKIEEFNIVRVDEASFPERPAPELLNICAELGPRIASGHYPINHPHRLHNVTLGDVMDWMQQAHDMKMVEEIELNVQRLADQYGWDRTLVWSTLYDHVPVGSMNHKAYIAIDRFESIPIILKQVEQYLEYNNFRRHENARPSEIKKIFQYQVLAYKDLMFWANLHSVSITRRCLSRALFPEGPYTENDLSPSKSIGTFINNLNREKTFGLINLSSTCTHWDEF